jgi:uncharacterized membrane protein YczE
MSLIRLGLTRTRSLDFWKRFFLLNVGLMCYGLAIALMLHAGIGLDPWSVFHVGLSKLSGLTYGEVSVLVGAAILGLSYLLFRSIPGLGTICNMLLIGPWVDFYNAKPWLPTAHGLAWGTGQFMVGVVLLGMASGLYISVRFGAGPRDGFVLGIAKTLRLSIRVSRGGLELSVLIVGFLLGGPPGLGTVLFALTVGIFMQFFLRLFGYHQPVETAASPQAAD